MDTNETTTTTAEPLMKFGDGGMRNKNGQPKGKISLRKLALDKAGYDFEGQYWGAASRTAGYIYIAECGPNYRRYTWAHDRPDAIRKLGINPEDLKLKR